MIGGPVGWLTLLKTKNIKGIVSYEPGGGIPFPEGQVPEESKILTLSKKTEGIEVPIETFMELYPNTDCGVLRRQPAGDGRTSRNL